MKSFPFFKVFTEPRKREFERDSPYVIEIAFLKVSLKGGFKSDSTDYFQKTCNDSFVTFKSIF